MKLTWEAVRFPYFLKIAKNGGRMRREVALSAAVPAWAAEVFSDVRVPAPRQAGIADRIVATPE
jgi:hypothetical protein